MSHFGSGSDEDGAVHPRRQRSFLVPQHTGDLSDLNLSSPRKKHVASILSDDADHIWVVEQAPNLSINIRSFDDFNSLKSFFDSTFVEVVTRVDDDESSSSYASTATTAESMHNGLLGGDAAKQDLVQYWFDIQTTDSTLKRSILELFGAYKMASGLLLENEWMDTFEVFSSRIVAGCARSLPGSQDASPVVGIVTSRYWTLTLHDGHLVPITNIAKQLQPMRMARLRYRLSGAWIISLIFQHSVEELLPSISKILSDIGSLSQQSSEQTLAIQHAVSKSVMFLCGKERVVRRLVVESVWRRVVALDASVIDRFQHTLSSVEDALELLAMAREDLRNVDSNLFSVAAAEMATASTSLSRKVLLLTVVASIQYPLQWVASSFGMNCSVPFMNANGYTDLTAFSVIVGCMGLYIVCAVVYMYFKFRKSSDIDK